MKNKEPIREPIPIEFIKDWYWKHKDDYLHRLINSAEVLIILEDLTNEWIDYGKEWKNAGVKK